MADDDVKIFVDEDWKARVQREKAEAKARDDEQPAEAEKEPADEEAPAPVASFTALISSLAAQAMFALGVLVPRDTPRVVVNLDEAKFTIDMLVMLRQKTKGNLTSEEDGQLTATVAELQQIYVARVQQIQENALQQAGITPDNLRA